MALEIPSKQRTLKHEALITGQGYRSKDKCIVRLLPAPKNTGIVFVGREGVISADCFHVVNSFANTSLSDGCFILQTVEHLMSALYGMFIDNVEVEVYGGIPLGDGSSSIFCNAIEQAGIVEQNAPRRYLEITKSISVENNGSFISISPHDCYHITYMMGNPYPKAVHGKFSFGVGENTFKEVYNSRTWGEAAHIAYLSRSGVKLDSSNCLILNNGSFNQELRYTNEPVRHKVLDLIGDLSLLFGMYIKGSVVAFNAGHKLHHELMKGIINDSSIGSNRRLQYCSG